MDLPIWQVDFWDTQLRKSENYGSKCEYVKNNPVRAGLVTNANEWPYQGEINVLQWHD
jgi:REP element-mobilizing transposase RayT